MKVNAEFEKRFPGCPVIRMRLIARMLAFVLQFLAGGVALAETYTWQGASGGSWNVAANWSVGSGTATAIPGASHSRSAGIPWRTTRSRWMCRAV